MEEITNKDLEGLDVEKKEDTSKNEPVEKQNNSDKVEPVRTEKEKDLSEILKPYREAYDKKLAEKDAKIEKLQREVSDLIMSDKSNTAAPKSMHEIVIDKINSKRNFKKW